MDLDLSEDQEFLRDTTRKFLEAEAPIEAVRRLADGAEGFARSWWQQGAQLGFTSLLVPEEHGGGSLAGEGLLDLVIVAEEMGRLVSPGPLIGTNVFAAAVAERGSAEQQEKLLPGIVAGELLASWALAEPDHRFWPEQLELEAEPVEGGFVLRGTKSPVESAGQVDWLLVTARSRGGLTQLLVPTDAPELEITPLRSLDLVRRHAEVRFDGVFVPASDLLGEIDRAEADAERQLRIAVVLQLAEIVGGLDVVFEKTLHWMFDRYSFGRPLASYQALKHRMADMKLWLEASQAAATAAAQAVQRRAPDAAIQVSAAKAFVGDYAPRILQECVQMHGGLGVTWECDLHLYLRRTVTNRVLYGSPREHRERVARRLLEGARP